MMKKNNTSVYHADGCLVVKLHQTEILKFHANEVELNSGGWQTATTKRRMNQWLDELGIKVFQKNWSWFVDTGESVLEFKDGMFISSNEEGISKSIAAWTS